MALSSSNCILSSGESSKPILPIEDSVNSFDYLLTAEERCKKRNSRLVLVWNHIPFNSLFWKQIVVVCRQLIYFESYTYIPPCPWLKSFLWDEGYPVLWLIQSLWNLLSFREYVWLLTGSILNDSIN